MLYACCKYHNETPLYNQQMQIKKRKDSVLYLMTKKDLK
jgi:hypothetical protein